MVRYGGPDKMSSKMLVEIQNVSTHRWEDEQAQA